MFVHFPSIPLFCCFNDPSKATISSKTLFLLKKNGSETVKKKATDEERAIDFNYMSGVRKHIILAVNNYAKLIAGNHFVNQPNYRKAKLAFPYENPNPYS